MELDMRKAAAAAAPPPVKARGGAPGTVSPTASSASAPGGAKEIAGRTVAAESAPGKPEGGGTAGGRAAPTSDSGRGEGERDAAASSTASPPAAAEGGNGSSSTSTAQPVTEVLIESPPKILRVIKPIYPPVALRAGLKGTVILRVSVSEAGRVTDIEVLKGVPGGLTDSAVQAVRSWRFEPAMRNGVHVPGVITIPIPFEP
jgi:TonB family protein